MGHLWQKLVGRSPLGNAPTLGMTKAIALFLTLLISFGLSACAGVGATDFDPAAVNPDHLYTYRSHHSADGIGKFFLGREIAKVMGHTEALWLERPSREFLEQPELAIAALDLEPTDVVADIGAGTGYFSFRMASIVSEGRVLAVDVQPEMIDILEFLKQDYHAENVDPILGSITNPKLPTSSVDLALLVDAYHEFEYPYEMMRAVAEALKPGGRVALIEYRQENPLIPIKGLHKMTQHQARRELQTVGLIWETTIDSLPQQHLMIFRKPESPSP